MLFLGDFRRMQVFLLLSLSLVSITCVASIFRFSKQDEKVYNKLLLTTSEGSKGSSKSYTALQERKGMQKDIYFTKHASRLHAQLRGIDSLLVLEQSEGKMKMVEKMKNVSCVMQDELYEENGKPMQTLRNIAAQEATYDYKSGFVLAHDVVISCYTLPGHTLITSLNGQKPIMEGRAKTVEFSLKEKSPKFSADHLKASFYGVMSIL